MITMDIAAVAHVVGGTLAEIADPSVAVTGAAADSRAVRPGDLYVAILGERVDGHDFAGQAQTAGAVVTLGSRPTGSPTIVVADPVTALGQLARHTLERLPAARVVAVTGSSGKTTTKDLIATLLADLGPTVAPPGSFNTEVGLPLTVLTATEATRYVVVEMGARGVGHIITLAEIAQPDIAVVLNVGSAHLGEFGGREQIAAAKAEIVSALDPAGLAVLNADDPLVSAMSAQTAGRVVRFGSALHANIRTSDVTLDELARPRLLLHAGGETVPVAMSMSGGHMVGNAAAAAAVALECGMPLTRVAELLNQAQPRSAMRMDVRRAPNGLTVIDDAYNANPESMTAALRALAAMSTVGRRIAVLGEMRELGADSPGEHERVGRVAGELGIDQVLAVGAGAAPIAAAAAVSGAAAVALETLPEAADWLRKCVGPADVVLVKASRSIGLESIVAELLGGQAGAER
ncbi:MAG: UDP-N-acetylmuramoyl-tripeptide--D-alanyl-D-alanine ligase [Candidatus Nanopelagicales bacterium]